MRRLFKDDDVKFKKNNTVGSGSIFHRCDHWFG